MELRELLTDDDAVSPVVGVILMVAITVVLAAGTASFVLGLGERTTQPAPQVSFDIEYQQDGNGNLTFIHDGGDNLDPGRISITADSDFHPAPGNDTGDLDGSAYRSLGLDSTVEDPSGGTQQWVGGEIQAGTGATVVGTSSSDDLSGATVRVVFEGNSGDRSTTLVEWEGPDA